ncbi:MAG: peptide chain release factor N(5)-glutamine methyltransferase [Candidatus Krumholzibacteriia bacterium]
MTDLHSIRELIRVTTAYLEQRGVESARLNAERLLADVLDLSRMELYFQHDRPVAGAELDRYRDLVRQRGRGEPLQTLIGEAEFYSRPFKVEPGVFIPRPETERLVELAVQMLTPPDHRLLAPRAMEIGAGSGVIACSLALEVPRLEIWTTDVNPRAVALTEDNAGRLGVGARVHPLQGDLAFALPATLRGSVDLLVSNPPYVRSGDLAGLPREVRRDPPAALDGGPDGLRFYRAVAELAPEWLRPGAGLALEIGDDQGEPVAAIVTAAGGTQVTVHEDYARRPRVVTARWPG